MDQSGFKRASRRLVAELIIVVAVTFHSRLPKNESYPQAWKYVLHHPLLIVHVVIGAIVVLEALVLSIRSLRSRQPLLSGLALAGLLLVLLAFVSGDRFAATQQNAPLNVMGIAWFGGLLSFGLGWYLGRRGRDAAPRRARSGAPADGA